MQKSIPQKTVVVVDDDPGVRACVRCVLQQEDFRVFEFASAREALRTLAVMGDEISALISDVRMPGIDGRAFAKIVRRSLPGLPILMMSGTERDEVSRDLPFLPKPFAPGSLIESVDQLLRQRHLDWDRQLPTAC